MKHLNKILFAFLMALAFEAQAQTEQNPWAVSFGVNAVGTSTSGIQNSNDYRIPALYNVKQNWNILPSINYLGLARAVGKNLSVGIQGSYNRIEKFQVYDKFNLNANSDNVVVVNPGDLKYFALDASARYSFMSLIKSNKIDPSFRAGLGYNWIGENNSASINVGPAVTFWFTELIGVELQTIFKSTGLLGEKTNVAGDIYTPDMPNHFQHTLGLVFQFGAKDSDGDGVSDKNDACPQVAGLKQFNGCPDTDGDGIIDGSDDCPNEFGTAGTNGCADKDGDGIADKDDRCPEFAGSASMKGCPDTDNDGIADKDDKCPKVAGTRANGGCPIIDTDNDGVPDSQDECPTVAGVSNNKGCPEVVANEAIQTMSAAGKKEALKTMSAAGKLVFFNVGTSTIKVNDGETIENLDKILKVLKAYPNNKFTIEGHADSDGSSEANQKLSEARANAVRNEMIEKGVNPNNLTIVGFGESKPIATNKTKTGKSKNRRTEVKP